MFRGIMVKSLEPTHIYSDHRWYVPKDNFKLVENYIAGWINHKSNMCSATWSNYAKEINLLVTDVEASALMTNPPSPRHHKDTTVTTRIL